MFNPFSSPALSAIDGSLVKNRIVNQRQPTPVAIRYSELQSECRKLEHAVSLLASSLESSLGSFISSSNIAASSLVYLNSLSLWLCTIKDSSCPTVETLPKVTEAKTFEVYSEAAMKLILLIGEIDDYASSDENKDRIAHLKQEATNTLALVVCTLSDVSKESPEWRCFVNGVDKRLEEAVAAIKPHAVAQFRNLLTSLNITFSNHYPFESKPGLQIHQIFISLCQFQRAHTLTRFNSPIRQLWVIEELADHLFTSCKHQFRTWIDDPKLIFDQSFKICEDYAHFMDKTLQPIVDEAKLPKYKCIERWLSYWVTKFSTFLGEELLPHYKDRSFIKAADLMLHFNNQIRSLALSYSLPTKFCGKSLKRFSCFPFALNRLDFIEFWAKLESEEPIKAVSHLIFDERTWKAENKASGVAEECMKILKSAADKRRLLRTGEAEEMFFTWVGVPIIGVFLEDVRWRYDRAEGAGREEEKCLYINMLGAFECAFRKEYRRSCFEDEIKHIEAIRKQWLLAVGPLSSSLIEPLTFEKPKDVRGCLNIKRLFNHL